jgi:membrane protein DedA with SNARE-associated domain
MTNGDHFLEILRSLPDIFIYFLLGLSAFVENIFPPIPGDTITAFGAFLVAIGRLNFLGVYLSTTLGNLVGFMALFWVGRYLGRRFFIDRDFWFFKGGDIIRAEDWFQRYGYFMIMINRFLPGIRSAISLAGGISGLKTNRVIILCLGSCAVWNLIWIFIGYTLGNNWAGVRTGLSLIMKRYNTILLFLFIALILLFVIKGVYKRKK